ncbi:MAG: hypothetical protein NZL88_09795 [Gaiellaceae bacterium]|nr:hypothetical protein [Gaiellaceae bacterium]
MTSATQRATDGREETLAPAFLAAFRSLLLADRELAANLRDAAQGLILRPWTELLTTAVARACQRQGWEVAAKNVGRPTLPYPRFEYLGIDVTAFSPGTGWRPSLAAFELENANAFAKVAYSLWKVATVKTQLAGLFCFRRSPDEVPTFVARLARDVLLHLPPLTGELVLVVGTRSSADTFPDGYFRPFCWDRRAKRFVASGLGGGRR